MLPSLFMGTASLQDSDFGGFVTRIYERLTIVGIWGSSEFLLRAGKSILVVGWWENKSKYLGYKNHGGGGGGGEWEEAGYKEEGEEEEEEEGGSREN